MLKSGTRHPPRPDGVPPNLFKMSKTYWLVPLLKIAMPMTPLTSGIFDRSSRMKHLTVGIYSYFFVSSLSPA